MSGNNILIDSTYSLFKIIDVFSLNEIESGATIKFEPLSIMVCGHLCPDHHGLDFRLDRVLNSYLDEINMFRLYNDILSKIDTRTLKI